MLLAHWAITGTVRADSDLMLSTIEAVAVLTCEAYPWMAVEAEPLSSAVMPLIAGMTTLLIAATRTSMNTRASSISASEIGPMAGFSAWNTRCARSHSAAASGCRAVHKSDSACFSPASGPPVPDTAEDTAGNTCSASCRNQLMTVVTTPTTAVITGTR